MVNDLVQDRRRSKRVPVGDGTFVCLTAPGRRPWHVLDIGGGGLSFRYIPALQSVEGVSELEIVTRDTGFSLENVPFRAVSDIELKETFGSHFQMRRCGVQFGALTQPQSVRLDAFIKCCSAEAA